MPTYRSVCDHDFFGCFRLVSNAFHYSEIICFQKFNPFFLTLLFFVFFCLIVTEPYYGVFPYLF